MSPEKQQSIKAIRLSREAYEKYGTVIAADESLPFKFANMGTAKRFNKLCQLENLRSDKAKLNLCVFRCSPLTALPLELRLLEKHEYSTQVFMPMADKSTYLAIVCLGKDKPDLSTLRAFLVEGSQGVSYYPGVWHYPMTALYEQIDFSCLVFEDDGADDCVIAEFPEPIFVEL